MDERLNDFVRAVNASHLTSDEKNKLITAFVEFWIGKEIEYTEDEKLNDILNIALSLWI